MLKTKLPAQPTVRITGSGPVAIVDDSGDALDIAERVFRESNVKNSILRYEGGEPFLAYLQMAARGKADVPSMILLDISMPEPDGFEVLRALRSHELFKNLPVVMLTSSNDEDDVKRALDMGANGYQVKPFGITKFVEFANSLLPTEN